MKIENLKVIIQNLELIIFDVDGVFTDGSVYLDEKGNELLKFSRIDGRGISLIRKRGLKMAVISSEDSNIIKTRMRKLNIDDIYIGIDNKLDIYIKLKEKYRLKDKNICFLGDDTQDLAILERVGLPCCPINAQKEVQEISLYKSPFKGGEGFVRDVCNLILENKS